VRDVSDDENGKANALLMALHNHRDVLPLVDRTSRNFERQHGRFLLPASKIALLVFGRLLLPLRI
jgi:hypothetical protein